MGNNVLPARAGELLRVVLLDQRVKAGKRTLLGHDRGGARDGPDGAGRHVPDRGLRRAEGPRAARPDLRPPGGARRRRWRSWRPSVWRQRSWCSRTAACWTVCAITHVRWPARRARCGASPGLPLLAVTVVLWCIEGSVYLAVARAVALDFSISGALYLVGLTNFVAALPAAPGSIGTFDAAVAFGSRVLGGSGGLVISYVILLRFVLYVPITIVGLVVLVVRYGGWARLRDITRMQQTSSA
ncbi:MAG: lysylphosphatidylglycerol synthase transmembrane domain-containing protein [Thermoleophilaceae bacterium]